METFADRANILALDLVDVNPVLDSQNMTGILAAELGQSALGKTILQSGWSWLRARGALQSVHARSASSTRAYALGDFECVSNARTPRRLATRSRPYSIHRQSPAATNAPQ